MTDEERIRGFIEAHAQASWDEHYGDKALDSLTADLARKEAALREAQSAIINASLNLQDLFHVKELDAAMARSLVNGFSETLDIIRAALEPRIEE